MTEMLATNKQFYICLKSQEIILDILCTHTHTSKDYIVFLKWSHVMFICFPAHFSDERS